MEEGLTTTRPATASGARHGGKAMNTLDGHLLLTRPSSSPALPTPNDAPSLLLPPRPVNLAQSLKVLCGSSVPGKPSLFESQGLGAYEYCEITSGAPNGIPCPEKETAV